MRSIHMKLGGWLLAGILFGTSAVTGILLSKEAEKAFYPVVSGTTIARHQPDGDGVLMWGTFTKERDCRFIEIAASSGAIPLDLETQDKGKHRGTTRAEGPQTFGPWRISPAIYPLSITVRHSCHALWDTSTLQVNRYYLTTSTGKPPQ